ncbi:hypothetical protein CSB45_06675 [candidate division KSB3 bacterium]|uniref:NurA domain-containing protein n=1 Tax=candidate division KSB3 bacterium TaxID=2044937 RepID=A0A2G6E6C2_9BACT|nr:MAG: hypothetical protein CSB45_06675 [candidate division KSB3 bacterium]PIE30081.1 MAG: hypothetical protein CSA57_05920 [candidate division KSB3 bacterium]
MLDFALVYQQIGEMVLEQKRACQSYDDKVALAGETLANWNEHWNELEKKLSQSRTSWLLAGRFHESFMTRHPLPKAPEFFTVVATDGSQIFPDRHELSACYLLNLGAVVLHYGSGEQSRLSSRPLLYYKECDMARSCGGNRVPITSEMISVLRGALEIQELAGLLEEAAEDSRQVIGFTDGTLILWNLTGKPQEFQQEILEKYLRGFEDMRRSALPFMGYISQPGSADVVNVLRVALCPENPTNCDRCPHKGQNAELPCESIAGVTDAVLFSKVLQEGERSTIFKSHSEILKKYGKQAVFFFYLHVGREIARIEIPQWLAENPELLALVHAAAYDQAHKGQGYPVSLAEAHERAVIRGPEREQFYRIVEDRYVREGLKVSISRKSFKKRNVTI